MAIVKYTKGYITFLHKGSGEERALAELHLCHWKQAVQQYCSKDKRKSLQTVRQAGKLQSTAAEAAAAWCGAARHGTAPSRAALADSPEAGDHAAEQEEAVALDEGRQEGEETIHGHADEQALPSAHLVRHAPPEKRPHHHAQVHNTAWSGNRERQHREGHMRTELGT